MHGIRKNRERKGLTQSELAAIVNISQPFLCEIENGTKRPSLDTLQKLASALGCTLDELVGKTA